MLNKTRTHTRTLLHGIACYHKSAQASTYQNKNLQKHSTINHNCTHPMSYKIMGAGDCCAGAPPNPQTHAPRALARWTGSVNGGQTANRYHSLNQTHPVPAVSPTASHALLVPFATPTGHPHHNHPNQAHPHPPHHKYHNNEHSAQPASKTHSRNPNKQT
jgi:hypothetical protein